jgi:hypothetical protein
MNSRFLNVNTIWALLSLLILCGACQTSHQTCSDKSIRLPAPKSGESRLYHVLRTNSVSAKQTITTKVVGQVQRPGVLVLPKGTTTLEAIIAAGGFTRSARFRDVEVTQGGKSYLLRLNQIHDWRTVQCFAYYGETADFPLEDGARIDVTYQPFAWQK